MSLFAQHAPRAPRPPRRRRVGRVLAGTGAVLALAELRRIAGRNRVRT